MKESKVTAGQVDVKKRGAEVMMTSGPSRYQYTSLFGVVLLWLLWLLLLSLDKQPFFPLPALFLPFPFLSFLGPLPPCLVSTTLARLTPRPGKSRSLEPQLGPSMIRCRQLGYCGAHLRGVHGLADRKARVEALFAYDEDDDLNDRADR